MNLDDFALFGRLHPLVLHFPIGLIYGALLLEVLATRGRVSRHAQGLLLWCAALSAAVSATAGWVLSHEEGYGGELLERHERLGIAIAALRLLAIFGVERLPEIYGYGGALVARGVREYLLEPEKLDDLAQSVGAEPKKLAEPA